MFGAGKELSVTGECARAALVLARVVNAAIDQNKPPIRSPWA